MYKQFLFLCFLLNFFFGNAQKPVPLGITFDCAQSDTIIHKADIPDCDTLVLTGTNSSSYRIKSYRFSFTKDGTVRDVECIGLCAMAYLLKMASGKVFIENLVIVSLKTGKEVSISKRFKFYLKP